MIKVCKGIKVKRSKESDWKKRVQTGDKVGQQSKGTKREDLWVHVSWVK